MVNIKRCPLDNARALQIIRSLAHCVDPLTGEVFPADAVYNAPDIVRALFVAEGLLRKETVASALTAPARAGKPWTPSEDRALLSAFDAGSALKMIAAELGRTTAGVAARLQKHGRLARESAQ